MMKQAVDAYWAENFASLVCEAGWPVKQPLFLDVFEDVWAASPTVSVRFRTVLDDVEHSFSSDLSWAEFVEHAFGTTGCRRRVRELLVGALTALAEHVRAEKGRVADA